MTVAQVSLSAFSDGARDALRVLAALPGAEEAWVVGGALRDALRGRPVGDLDVVVRAGAARMGRELADRLRGTLVPLDERRGVVRVAGTVQVDIADFRGPDLAADLRGRDFTVNALAAPVVRLVSFGSAEIDDATGGLADLADRRVRPCGPRSLGDDPLRIMRAARLAMEPGWTLAPGLEAAAADAMPGLVDVSAERVRDELIAMLASPHAGRGVRLLDQLGAAAVILPESLPMRLTPQPDPHRFDVWEHSLRAVEAAAQTADALDLLAPWTAELRLHLSEGLGDRMTRAEAVKLAALLHDVAKPDTRSVVDGRVRFIGHDKLGAERARAIGARLRLSGRATHVVATLVDQHLRPMHLAQAGVITDRARYRLFRDLGDEVRDLLLLALADAAAVRGDSPLAVWHGSGGAVLRTLMTGMSDVKRASEAPPLVRGGDVMAILDMDPGPAVGRVLADVREAQALGRIRTREDALLYLRRLSRGNGGRRPS